MAEPATVLQADFDRLASFDTDAWDHNSHYHAFLLSQLPARCEAALEVGCGTGELARLLARRAGHVDALDLSPEMIRVARERSPGYDNITFQVADVMACELSLQGYDAIISVATLHHLPLEAALARLRDTLRPGGHLVILDLFKSAGAQDRIRDLLSVPASAALRLLKDGRLRESAASRAAWAAHGRHDVYLTVEEVQRACETMLPGASVRHHLLWRYSLVWRKPSAMRAQVTAR